MPSISIREALDHYARDYLPSRNFADRTRVEYIHDLADLIEVFERLGATRIDQVSLSILEQYLAELDRRGYAGATRKRKYCSLRSFFGFLSSNDFVVEDVTRKLRPPKAESKEPRVLSEMEYKRLLRACAYETRDAAILELLLQSGMRLSELTRLTLEDIELPAQINHEPANIGILRIFGGKGRKDRTLPLNFKACKAIKAYLAVRPKVETRSVFINKFGHPLGPRGVQLLVQKYMREAGIRGAHVHSLRHTFGTHHVAKGTSLRTVQEALGHKDLKTTSIYVSLAREVMNKEIQEHAL